MVIILVKYLTSFVVLHIDTTEKLNRATDKIQILQSQVDDVHESAALISNLTESNLELDEVYWPFLYYFEF